MLFLGSGSLADMKGVSPVALVQNKEIASSDNENLYFNQNSAHVLETPDLKTSQSAFVYGVSTPQVYSSQTLGTLMGGAAKDQNRSEMIEHTVEPGDTLASVAADYGLSINTILWANDLTKNSVLKTGQTLIILPVDGVLHIVKSGDTIESIAKTYKANIDDIIEINGFTDGKVFVGDPAIVPGGTVAPKVSLAVSVGSQNILPDSFFIFPLLRFKVTQGLHPTNGIDISSLDGLGSPVYAAAGGVVLRAGYDRIGGNRVTILHTNGVVTYYGHLNAMLVKPGDLVQQGQQIGTEGQTGRATGPHVHFQVIGASNFLAKYRVGTVIDVTKK